MKEPFEPHIRGPIPQGELKRFYRTPSKVPNALPPVAPFSRGQRNLPRRLHPIFSLGQVLQSNNVILGQTLYIIITDIKDFLNPNSYKKY